METAAIQILPEVQNFMRFVSCGYNYFVKDKVNLSYFRIARLKNRFPDCMKGKISG